MKEERKEGGAEMDAVEKGETKREQERAEGEKVCGWSKLWNDRGDGGRRQRARGAKKANQMDRKRKGGVQWNRKKPQEGQDGRTQGEGLGWAGKVSGLTARHFGHVAGVSKG